MDIAIPVMEFAVLIAFLGFELIDYRPMWPEAIQSTNVSRSGNSSTFA